jgi:hypothetical protein
LVNTTICYFVIPAKAEIFVTIQASLEKGVAEATIIGIAQNTNRVFLP